MTTSGPGISHVVLTVRHIEASHAFYTSVVGFEQCGQFHSDLFPDIDMRFYRGDASRHHDLALVQSPDPSTQPPVEPFNMFSNRVGVNHLAISYPSREAWLAKLAELQGKNIPVVLRGNHGMTHSCYLEDPDGHGVELLYDLPREVWEGDVDGALSHFELIPNEKLLHDQTDYKVFGRTKAS
jgi:catechol 2,3-dioxygenase